ncbi:uncharacterized protein LOC122458909 [Dermochelys coriacea]|uniref:uncharacterized protein LOC122458909 n=1 Tax=Dermochelys coriacea TaxID=27794 RepID=UPI001CA8C103|nr:uncharacterized protein LOC122458909 [Dermochelys coriacea]
MLLLQETTCHPLGRPNCQEPCGYFGGAPVVHSDEEVLDEEMEEEYAEQVTGGFSGVARQELFLMLEQSSQSLPYSTGKPDVEEGTSAGNVALRGLAIHTSGVAQPDKEEKKESMGRYVPRDPASLCWEEHPSGQNGKGECGEEKRAAKGQMQQDVTVLLKTGRTCWRLLQTFWSKSPDVVVSHCSLSITAFWDLPTHPTHPICSRAAAVLLPLHPEERVQTITAAHTLT